MKQCPYCGKKYPDEATVCLLDETPLAVEKIKPQKRPPKLFPRFALVSENQVPVSLIITSYLFLIPGAFSFGLAFLFLTASFFMGEKADLTIILIGLIFGAIGLFYLGLSRGLRRCYPVWRKLALFHVWIGVLLLLVFLTTGLSRFILMTIYFYFLPVLAWTQWVLTRPKIRALFIP